MTILNKNPELSIPNLLSKQDNNMNQYLLKKEK